MKIKINCINCYFSISTPNNLNETQFRVSYYDELQK